MAYATPTELRVRYRLGTDKDEFASETDAKLNEALTSATAEIDGWLPVIPDSTDARLMGVLREKALVLARWYMHQNEPLAAEHPVVVDMRAARDWLKGLAKDDINLPGSPSIAAPAIVAGDAPAMVYDNAFSLAYRNALTRGSDRGRSY
jgi:phage gp36-like protein